MNVLGVNATSFVRARLISTYLTLYLTKFSNADAAIWGQRQEGGQVHWGWGGTELTIGRRSKRNE